MDNMAQKREKQNRKFNTIYPKISGEIVYSGYEDKKLCFCHVFIII